MNGQVLTEFGNVLEANITIPVRDLRINEKPYSRGLESHRLTQRKKSIAKHGWFPSQKIAVLPDNIILDGNHRVQSCRNLGYLDMEIPATIIEPYNYLKEASLFMALNADNPTLSSLSWWRGMNESGDIAATLIWKLDSDSNSSLYGKIKTVSTKSKPFSIPIVCSMINFTVFNAIDFYKRGRGYHQTFSNLVSSVPYSTIVAKTNKFVNFVEAAYEKHDVKQNPLPYVHTFQRGILRFYLLLQRNNKLNRQADIDRAILKASKVNLRVLRREGATEIEIGKKLLTKYNEALRQSNRLSFDD